MNTKKSWVTPTVFVLSISSTRDICDPGKLPDGVDGTAECSGGVPTS
jgi:hypothetical protein